MLIDSNGQLGTASSSRSVKQDINPLGNLGRLNQLKPVSFRYREDPDEKHFGLIAEQVAKVLPELAVYDEEGKPETVQYQELPALLLAQNQALQAKLKRQRAQYGAQNRHQQKQIDRLLQQADGR